MLLSVEYSTEDGSVRRYAEAIDDAQDDLDRYLQVSNTFTEFVTDPKWGGRVIRKVEIRFDIPVHAPDGESELHV